MIFSFRYRDGVRGVTTKHVEAADLKTADHLAQAWVNRRPGAVFIPNSVEPFCIDVADLAVVVEPEQASVAGPVPSGPEQRERLKAQGAARKAGTGVGADVPQTERVGA